MEVDIWITMVYPELAREESRELGCCMMQLCWQLRRDLEEAVMVHSDLSNSQMARFVRNISYCRLFPGLLSQNRTYDRSLTIEDILKIEPEVLIWQPKASQAILPPIANHYKTTEYKGSIYDCRGQPLWVDLE